MTQAVQAGLRPKPHLPGQKLLGPLLVLAAWALVSGAGWVKPDQLPPPRQILDAFAEMLHTGYLQDNLLVSLARAGLGLAYGIVAGVLLALVAGLSRPGDALFDGLIQVKRAIPNLALIPLFIMWLGIGETMKIVIIALGVLVPIYINTHAALRDIDLRYVELAESVTLTRAQFLRYIVIPGCTPGFFVGLRLAATHAWTALVVVETINATSGIGYMITQARIYGQMEIVIAGLIVYGILGFGTDALIRALQKKVLAWRLSIA
ncbi:ABC transporter permease [Bordetella sp. N]|uniref:ABC transporter permease n=1 Tax=Bordetella sp. N TaxID=1746199 RepID=UPI00070E5ABC|nr:ABC transporter permease [Bordetella sp. N]ALM82868.1 ABC transporter permease [Bordetella sp. N]